MSESNSDNQHLTYKKIKDWFVGYFWEFFKVFEGLAMVFFSLFASDLYKKVQVIISDKDYKFYEKIVRIFGIDNLWIFILPVSFYLFMLVLSYKKTKKVQKELDDVKATIPKLQNQNKELKGTEESLNIKLNEAQEAISSLKNTNLEEGIDITSKFLAFLFSKFGLTDKDRISIYKLVKVSSGNNGEMDEFLHIFGRYSINNEYKNINRKRFPKSEGVIGKALTNDAFHKIIRLKDAKTNRQYINSCKKFGIPKDVAEKLSMKSVVFFPMLITDKFNARIGILLIESIEIERDFKEQEIRSFVGDCNDFILELLVYDSKLLLDTSTEDKV